MNDHRINLRYATALYEFASEQNMVEEVYKDVLLISDVIEDSRELRLLLKSPVVFNDRKLSILREIFSNKVSRISFLFMQVLVKKHRELYLHGILKSYLSIYRATKNIKVAEVISAIPLDESTKDQLINKLEKQSGSSIQLEETVDESIIGGLIVKVEGVKFDDSIRKKIQDLKQEFNVNTYIKGF